MTGYRRAGRALLATLFVYAVLVSTNLGEFWPFSIYPMFSRAGTDWSRVVVRDISGANEAVAWDTLSGEPLPGIPYALNKRGVNTNDLAALVARGGAWDRNRTATLRGLLAADARPPSLLVMRVYGRLTDEGAVRIHFVPLALVTDSTARFNPEIHANGSHGP